MKDTHGGDIWAASKDLNVAPEEIVDFSASINPLGPSPAVLKAINEGIRLISPYPDPRARGFIEAVSRRHGLDAASILVGSGSNELIYLIPQALKPKKALIVEPAFSEYASSLKLQGCKIHSFVLKEKDAFALDIKRLKKSIERGCDILYIANPANPTGVGIDKKDILETASVCKRRGIVLVVDEAFADFCDGISIRNEAAGLKNVIVLRSMTKFHAMAGLRLGYAVAEKGMIRRLERFIPPWSVNTLASLAGAAALNDSDHIRKTLKYVGEERGFLYRGVNGISGLKAFNSDANYILVKITSTLTAAELKARLFKKNILIRDLSSFRGLGGGYFRAAVKNRAENTLLISSLKEAFEAVEAGSPGRALFSAEVDKMA